MPRFSVIIPLYNKAPYVRKTVESVLGQSFGDYELIKPEDVKGVKDRKILQFRIIPDKPNSGFNGTTYIVRCSPFADMRFQSEPFRFRPTIYGLEVLYGLCQLIPVQIN